VLRNIGKNKAKKWASEGRKLKKVGRKEYGREN
jgi:hypothetical protein